MSAFDDFSSEIDNYRNLANAAGWSVEHGMIPMQLAEKIISKGRAMEMRLFPSFEETIKDIDSIVDLTTNMIATLQVALMFNLFTNSKTKKSDVLHSVFLKHSTIPSIMETLESILNQALSVAISQLDSNIKFSYELPFLERLGLSIDEFRDLHAQTIQEIKNVVGNPAPHDSAQLIQSLNQFKFRKGIEQGGICLGDSVLVLQDPRRALDGFSIDSVHEQKKYSGKHHMQSILDGCRMSRFKRENQSAVAFSGSMYDRITEALDSNRDIKGESSVAIMLFSSLPEPGHAVSMSRLRTEDGTYELVYRDVNVGTYKIKKEAEFFDWFGTWIDYYNVDEIQLVSVLPQNTRNLIKDSLSEKNDQSGLYSLLYEPINSCKTNKLLKIDVSNLSDEDDLKLYYMMMMFNNETEYHPDEYHYTQYKETLDKFIYSDSSLDDNETAGIKLWMSLNMGILSWSVDNTNQTRTYVSRYNNLLQTYKNNYPDKFSEIENINVEDFSEEEALVMIQALYKAYSLLTPVYIRLLDVTFEKVVTEAQNKAKEVVGNAKSLIYSTYDSAMGYFFNKEPANDYEPTRSSIPAAPAA